MAQQEFRILRPRSGQVENIEMRKMTNKIQSIPLAQLTPHPDNPNRMSKATFAKLVRNIEQTGRYEPLIVRKTTVKSEDLHINSRNARKTTDKNPIFEIINGYHRWLALKQLGKSHADVIVWDVDDGQVDILLATLNRLCGQDVLDRKLALLKRLSEKARPAELAKLLPQTKAQIKKLIELDSQRISLFRRGFSKGTSIANPLVFFVSDSQQQTIEAALDHTLKNDKTINDKAATRAAKRAAALACICRDYIDNNNDQRVTKDD